MKEFGDDYMDLVDQPPSMQNVKCKFCPLEASHIDLLLEHCYSSHFHCMECGKTFMDEDSILEHLASTHVLRVKCVMCPYKTFR